MSIEGRLENAIIADLQRDPVLQAQPIRNHDYPGAIAGDNQYTDPENPSVIIVTATDRGEFKMGSGIKNLNVEVQIRVNGAADNFGGTLLDDLTDRVRFRLMPSPAVTAIGRENTFSQNGLKVFGITTGEITQRTESGLERIRMVPATFIVAQVSA